MISCGVRWVRYRRRKYLEGAYGMADAIIRRKEKE
jgi:hypothetical protein